MNSNNSYTYRHQIQRVADDADQAEFLALKDGSAVVDFGVYDERVAGALDDFEVNDPSIREQWHQEDLKYDTAVGKVHEQIENRVDILGSAYPFNLDGNILSYSPLPRTSRVYEFFLSICNANTLTTGDYVWLPRIFERITAKLVAAYFVRIPEQSDHPFHGKVITDSIAK